MTRRPLAHATGPTMLAAIGSLALWRAFRVSDLVFGVTIGVIAGFIAGWLLGISGRGRAPSAAAAARVVGALTVLIVGLAAVARNPLAVSDLPSTISIFLNIGLPADGLDDLAMVPYTLTALVVAIAVAAALRALLLAAIVVAAVGLTIAAILAAPVGVPAWVTGLFGLALAGTLLVASRFDYSELEPLIGTSTTIRRNQHWWRPAVVWWPAAALGLVALLLPLPGAFDVRQYVQRDLVIAADDNPLALAARLRTDPPDAAEGVHAVVEVDGPSPGRVRVAVLDSYAPEGWHQQAEFTITGTRLAPGLFESGDRPGGGTTTAVTVVDGPAQTGFAATPTAGTPQSLADATAIRFAPEAGLLLATDDVGAVTFVTAIDVPPPAGVAIGTVGDLDRRFGVCPDSPVIASTAQTLTEGLADPMRRIDAISSWMKILRIYDPAAPGGQTINSVERFVGQEFARGDLEVFVTAFALLARCAGVPVRVVVGYPAPAADSATALSADQVSAWVEVPLAGVGWVPVDVLPTPAEQQRQAELAAAPPPEPGDAGAEPDTAEEPAIVDPVAPRLPGDDTSPWAIAMVLAGVVVMLTVASATWSIAVRRRTVGRRSRVTDPARASTLAWTTLLERFHDNGATLGAHLTASETARATAGQAPAPVTRMMGELAGIVDRARFAGDLITDEDAGLAWAFADESLHRLPSGWAVRVAPLRHPRRAVARLRLTRGLPRNRTRWSGEVPASATVFESPAVPDIPGFVVEARIGVGSTAAVYRARQDVSGRDVAIKVFSTDVTRGDIDPQRVLWEARVAETVSGRANLPEILGTGFTATGHPFLVSKLYRNGTLARRVRVGGPMSAAEVVEVGRQLAIALDALHENGVLHGDVKPDNVFIDDDDSMILGDLGGAWMHHQGQGAMTPAYAAPEVFLGHVPTMASDIYSLGLTLMFATTGRTPPPGAPPSVDDVVDAFGSDVAVRLLEVDPRRRFRTARAVAAHFGADIDERTVGATATAFRLPPPSWTMWKPEGSDR